MATPTDVLRTAARDLPRSPAADDPLVRRLASASTVLLGEASHGTHEFYDLRAELTRTLIADHGFRAVAIEGDWPDAWDVHRYASGRSGASDVDEALSGFTRFPLWMWRNTVTAEFVAWLRQLNLARPDTAHPVAFVGLDLYSLRRSVQEVLAFLDRTDPAAAARARDRYACFDHTSIDGQAYGYATATGRQESCEPAVVEQLGEVLAGAHDGAVPDDDLLDVVQNARLVAGAEEYYRAMFRGRADSWNLRDGHMASTLEAVRDHLAERGDEPRVVVWAHNSHLGDARATEMARRGEHNLGQLVRERHAGEVVSVGMTTHRGEVTAASTWDGPLERKRVRDALPGSHEATLHATGHERFWVDLAEPDVREALAAPRLERAIGVIYRPETERLSHYFHANLSDQFDAVIHLDRTRAVEPLEPSQGWHAGEEAPETFPFGE